MESRLLIYSLRWADWKGGFALRLCHCDHLAKLALLFCDHLGIAQIAVSRRAFEGLPEVPDDRDDAIWARDLHLQVGLVRTKHELGKRGQTQKSMVGTAEVGDLKPNRLSPEVFLCAKNDIQPNAP